MAANAPPSKHPPRDPDLSTDRAWLDAFRRGERPALERVFRAYAPLVFVVLARGTRSKDGAFTAPGIDDDMTREDLLHDIFIEAFKPELRARYDGLRPYAPFVLQIARHRLMDHARRQGRARARHADDVSLDTLIDDDGTLAADARLLRDEDAQLARAFHASLSDDDQAFVNTRFIDGESQDASAHLLSRSRQQIRTLETKIRGQFQAFVRNFTASATNARPTDEGDE